MLLTNRYTDRQTHKRRSKHYHQPVAEVSIRLVRQRLKLVSSRYMRRWRTRWMAWSDSITCQVERWRAWKRGSEKRQELCATGSGVFSWDGEWAGAVWRAKYLDSDSSMPFGPTAIVVDRRIRSHSRCRFNCSFSLVSGLTGGQHDQRTNAAARLTDRLAQCRRPLITRPPSVDSSASTLQTFRNF